MKRLLTLTAAALMTSALAVPAVAQESGTTGEANPPIIRTPDAGKSGQSQKQDRATQGAQGSQAEKPDAAAGATPPADDPNATANMPQQKEGGAQATGPADEQTGTQGAAGATEDQSGKTDSSAGASDDATQTPGVSKETTASVNITSEQKTEIRNVIVESAKPVDVDFDVNVGVAVPRTVTLQPLPTRVVEILPQYEAYEYFVLADGRIVIVEPATMEIVYILAV